MRRILAVAAFALLRLVWLATLPFALLNALCLRLTTLSAAD